MGPGVPFIRFSHKFLCSISSINGKGILLGVNKGADLFVFWEGVYLETPDWLMVMFMYSVRGVI
jgi:hypothetical protein